jgi:hypothetical protein
MGKLAQRRGMEFKIHQEFMSHLAESVSPEVNMAAAPFPFLVTSMPPAQSRGMVV